MSAELVPLPGSSLPPPADAKRLQDANPSSSVEITITLRGPALPGADYAPSYGLSSKEFAEKYGAQKEDVETIRRVLEEHGFKVLDASLPTRSMRISGTVAQLEKAFQSKLGIYGNAEQGEFRAREGGLMIPGELDGIVTGVFGLDERQIFRPRRGAKVKHLTPPRKKAKVKYLKPPKKKVQVKHLTPLGPADLEARYNFPPGNGQGQEIAIAELGGKYIPSDLTKYCAKYNRAVPMVHFVPVNTTPRTSTIWTQEMMMDVEIIAGLCSGANISVYYGPPDEHVIDLLDAIIVAKPLVLSVSWGSAEDDLSRFSANIRNEFNLRLEMIALLGITVCVASGDDGSGDKMTDGNAHVDFPAASPFVLSVGGTMLSATQETAWWVNPGTGSGGASGGGVSVNFPRPLWQNVNIPSLNAGSLDGRVVPDVAALASSPGYDTIVNGKSFPNAGTSAAAPLWAALIARVNVLLPVNKRQRFLTPLLYQPGLNGQPLGMTVCHDITGHDNESIPGPGGGYMAQMGFDAVTGWGTPDGMALLAALQ